MRASVTGTTTARTCEKHAGGGQKARPDKGTLGLSKTEKKRCRQESDDDDEERVAKSIARQSVSGSRPPLAPSKFRPVSKTVAESTPRRQEAIRSRLDIWLNKLENSGPRKPKTKVARVQTLRNVRTRYTQTPAVEQLENRAQTETEPKSYLESSITQTQTVEQKSPGVQVPMLGSPREELCIRIGKYVLGLIPKNPQPLSTSYKICVKALAKYGEMDNTPPAPPSRPPSTPSPSHKMQCFRLFRKLTTRNFPCSSTCIFDTY